MAEGEEDLPKEERNPLVSIDETLKEILKWTRFANISKLKEVLISELDSDEKKLSYDGSDGVNGLKELVDISGAPERTIHNWWQIWFRLGLVTEAETRKGRMMKIVSLDDAGIKVPKKSKVQAVEETVATQSQATLDRAPQQRPVSGEEKSA